MRRTGAATAILIAGTVAAGCGSSAHKSTSSSGSTGSGTPAASTAAPSGPYGSGSSSSSGSSSGSSSAAVKLGTKQHGRLGTILAAGPKQLTVYMFEGDVTGKSNCNGACASVWPPVTAGSAAAAGLALQADITTITRSDGGKQLAYKGHPLYYFIRDKDSGDAYGEGVHGFGHSWYVLAPSGKKVDNS